MRIVGIYYQSQSTDYSGFIWIWLLMGLIAAAIGSRKGRGFTSFLVGVLLGPIGILLAIIAKPNEKKVAQEQEKRHREAGQVRCGACYSWIDPRATICPKCRTARASTSQASAAAGWYDAPDEPGRIRFWDGTAWTDQYEAAVEPGEAT